MSALPRPSRPILPLAALLPLLVVVNAAGCGPSIQATYESDVRFEHCMALDSRPDVKPTIRRACWVEWVEQYNFGQTRDRVDYAQRREKQLRTASDFDEADWALPDTRAAAAPEPTSAFAPPPITVAGGDAGAPGAADAGAAGTCLDDCEQTSEACRAACKTAQCEKACTARYKRCAKRCK
jgi:hypothetical protein